MTPEDLARIHAAAFTQARPWSAAEFADLLDSPLVHLTPAPHGFALWRAVAGEVELLTIAVAPEAQGHGHGTRLMHAFLTEAAQVAEDVFLEVAADNAPAHALYVKAGFAESGRRPGYYSRSNGAAIDAILMSRRLCPVDNSV